MQELERLKQRMQWYIDEKIIPNCRYGIVSTQGEKSQFDQMLGSMDGEGKVPLADDAIYRVFSHSKLIGSVAVMCLFEDGLIELDQPVSDFLPVLADLQVLREGATEITDTEALNTPITIRHLLSHTSGLSYGFIDPFSLIDSEYLSKGPNLARKYDGDLLEFVTHLAQRPLAFQPGTDWRYSVAVDVLGCVIEVVSGQSLQEFLEQRIFKPLGMSDTNFYVRSERQDAVINMFQMANLLDPMQPEYIDCEKAMKPPVDEPPKFCSMGGGLFSSFKDYISFLTMLCNKGSHNGQQIIKPQTLEMMLTNQLPVSKNLQFPLWEMPDTGFGLGFALRYSDSSKQELQHYYWGGLAGTHTWISPTGDIAYCMTQLMNGFWHPFSHDFYNELTKEKSG